MVKLEGGDKLGLVGGEGGERATGGRLSQHDGGNGGCCGWYVNIGWFQWILVEIVASYVGYFILLQWSWGV